MAGSAARRKEKKRDKDIAWDVMSALGADERIEPSGIEIVVDDGVVYLEGMVGGEVESNLAELIAEEVNGVLEVVNNLRIILSGYRSNPWPGESPAEIGEEGVEGLLPPEVREIEDVEED